MITDPWYEALETCDPETCCVDPYCYKHPSIYSPRLMPGRVSFPLKSLGPRPKLRVHDPEEHYRELDRKADEILEKVSQEGESSLTASERRILADYSRRMRQKHR